MPCGLTLHAEIVEKAIPFKWDTLVLVMSVSHFCSYEK